MLGYRNSVGLLNGGKGQHGDQLDPDYVVPWWSTEHNIDTWWCSSWPPSLRRDSGYREAADDIQAALLSWGWEAAERIFWQGGGHDGDPTVNDGAHALDMHTWGAGAAAQVGRAADAGHRSIARRCSTS